MTYHSYWSDKIPEELVPHREALGKTLATRPDWRLWQSEYCVMEWGRDLTIDTALRVARVIHCDLTLANASSWQWWLAVANENFKSGLIYTDYRKPGDAENILESKTLWALGNYSRFIRPGMRRIAMEGGPQDIKGLMASAYLDRPNRRVVAVLVNMADKPQAVRITLANGGKLSTKPLKVTPHITSASENLTVGQPADATRGLEIPGRSVVTLVSF
jgi:O-glycosyl hydrolase